MFASLVMSTRGKPLSVWFGAAGAFLVHVVIATTIGVALFHLVPHRALEGIVAFMFVVGAVLAIREARKEAQEEAIIGEGGGSGRRVVTTAFVVIFLAEWGDLTQILTANLAAHYHSPSRSASVPCWPCGRWRRWPWSGGRASCGSSTSGRCGSSRPWCSSRWPASPRGRRSSRRRGPVRPAHGGVTAALVASMPRTSPSSSMRTMTSSYPAKLASALGLLAAELEQHPPPGRRKRGFGQDPPEDVGAVGTPVVGQRGFECRVSRCNRARAGVGTYGTTPTMRSTSRPDDRERAKRSPRTPQHRCTARRQRPARRCRSPRPAPAWGARQHLGDGPRPRAQVDRRPSQRQERHGAAGQGSVCQRGT